ncbi:uncharacterized protein LOC125038399 [Penaeus chinensis]|uniref:uncharacterized protein LOC125038399 n=1 Tax=Penaeus chinensis TaxID=139456 RepID=UPI001FB6FC7E|nr:uncharacterized protein LOC125038399 [Penaeus chinensis]XP_047487870.1 uncharacterized protein LOC125038399 [Penaeus chinensis]
MELPLQILHDTLIKKKTSCAALHWMGEDAGNVYTVGTNHVEKIHLPSGNSSKVSKLSSVLKEVVAINNNYNGSNIYGIVSSGDLFFWDLHDSSLKHASGIPELVTHLPNADGEHHSKGNEGRLHAIYTAFRHFQQQGTETSKEENDEVQSHFKPKIFASDDCSTVIVVLGAVQVYIWEKEGMSKTREKDIILCGNWSVVACPSSTPMPSLQSHETQISVCFSSEEPFRKSCHVTFSFLDGATFIATTLTLQWGRASTPSTPAKASVALWNTFSVALRKMGMEEEIFQREGLLVSRYAHNQSLMCTAVNSSKFPISKLVYLHPLCNTSLVVPVGKIKGHLNSATRSHWVNDLAWSRDNTYIAGCLRSGCIFLATRMGSLLTISCPELPVQLHPSEFLPVHPSATPSQDRESSGSVEAEELPNLSFHVSFHPKKDQLLLLSSVRASVLVLPDNGKRDADVVDKLLVSANHALYILGNSALTHDYAYIHCSTWRLARSVADLTQNESGLANPSKYEVKLLEAENMLFKEREMQVAVRYTEGEQLIRSVVDPLLAAWTITLTHRKPQLQEWQERARNVAGLVVKLVRNLMQASANDDQSEHQAQILQMLQLFHSFIRVLELWPSSLHMLKPSLWLTHHILHTLLRCEKHAGEGSMVDTLLILSQTLLSVEDTLSQAYTFKPILAYTKDSLYGVLEPAAAIEVTNMKVVIACNDEKSSGKGSSLAIFRMRNLWLCMHMSARKLYLRLQEQKYNEKIYRKAVLILSIVQSGLAKYNYSFHSKKSGYSGGHKLYLNGIICSAVEEWKTDIIATVFRKGSKKNMGKRLHSILYALLLNHSFSSISSFLLWILGILKSQCFTIYQTQPSHKAHKLSSTPKPKKKQDKYSPKMNDLDISEIVTSDSKRESMLMQETLTQTHDSQKEEKDLKIMAGSNWKNYRRNYVENARDMDSENSHMNEQSRVCHKRQIEFILAVRKLIGSLGRVMMAAVLQQDVSIPSPINPHIVRASWMCVEEPIGKGTGEVITWKETKRAIQESQWSSQTAAQALAIAGYWADVTVLAQELGDAKTALVASLMATSLARRKNKEVICVPEPLHPASLMKSCILTAGPQQEIQPAVFNSFSELFQLAAITNVEILPDVIQHCLARMREVVNSMDFKVQSNVYLPAPPVFCPQFLLDEAPGEQQQASSDEHALRREIAGWVQLFSSVASASGIARPLLREICAHEPNAESELPPYQDLVSLTDMLGPAECYVEAADASGWPSISQSWLEFLRWLWMLQVRDKLWLCLRSYSKESFVKSKKRSAREKEVVEILFWCEKLYKLSESCSWKEDIVATGLTAAGSVLPSPSVAQALARLILHPSKLPSLLKDRASRLFDLWKKTEISVVDLPEKERKTKKKLFTDERTSTLYTLFENACSEALSKSGDFGAQDSVSPQDTLTILLESPNDEFMKMLSLYANMTFRKDAENFPQHITQIPKFPEFGELIKKRELQAVNLRKFSAGTEFVEGNQNCTFFKALDEVTTGDFKERKGFFRNLGICQKDTGSSLMLKAKTDTQDLFRTCTPLLDQSKATRSRYDSFSRKSVGSASPQKAHRKSHSRQNRSQRSRHNSLSLHKKRQNVFSIKRSHSVSTLERKDRNTNSSGFSQEFLTKEVPLNLFLMLNNHLLLNIQNKGFHNTVCLMQWILSRERKFCLSRTIPKNGEDSVFKKVDLSLQDIILAFSWDFIAENNSLPVTSQNSMTKKRGKMKMKKSALVGELSAVKSNLLPAQTLVENLHEDHIVNSEKTAENMRKNSKVVPTSATEESEISKEGRNVLDAGLSTDIAEKVEEETQGIRGNRTIGEDNLSKDYETEFIMNEAEMTRKEEEEEDIPDENQCQEVESVQDDNSAVQTIVSPSFGATAEKGKSEVNKLENSEKMDSSKDIHLNSEVQNNKSDLVHKEDLKADNLTKPNCLADRNFVDVSTQYSVPLSDNSWKPFRPKSRMSKKPPTPRLVIEAKGQGAVIRQQESSTSAVRKKKSLTPVETPSEVLDTPFYGPPKILRMNTPQDSRVLSLSDLDSDDDGGNTCLSNSMALPNDNTLDDVTLPESLHVSELEEDFHYISSCEKGNEVEKFRSHVTQNESRKMNTTVTINRPAKLSLDHSKRLDTRAVPIHVKPIHTEVTSSKKYVTRKDIDIVPKQKGIDGQAFKLLTLPVSLPTEFSEAATERYQPLKLKKIPYQFLQNKYLPESKKLITKTSEHKSEDTGSHMKRTKMLKFKKEPPSNVFKEQITLLAVPTYTPCQKSAQEKPLKLLDPQQVFTFADRNVKNEKLAKFKVIHNKKSVEEPEISKGIKVKSFPYAGSNIEVVSDTHNKINKDNKALNEKVSESPASCEPEKPKLLTVNQEYEMKQDAMLLFPATQRVDKACQHITPQPFVNSIETQTVENSKNVKDDITRDTALLLCSDTEQPIRKKFSHAEIDEKIGTTVTVNNQEKMDVNILPQESNKNISRTSLLQNRSDKVERLPEVDHQNEVSKNYGQTSAKQSRKETARVETRPQKDAVVEVKDSDLETKPTEIPCPVASCGKNMQTQTDHAATMALQQTDGYCVPPLAPPPASPPSYSPVPPPAAPPGKPSQMALSLNPTLLDVDRASLQQSSKDLSSVLTQVDIPREIVQGRLDAMGDKLNETIYGEDLDKIDKSVAERDLKVKSEIRDNRPINEVRISDSKSHGNNFQRWFEDNVDDAKVERSKSHSEGTSDASYKESEISKTKARPDIILKKQSDFIQERHLESPLQENRTIHKCEQKEPEVHAPYEDKLQAVLGSRKEEMTMNDLVEAFSEGKITFEDMCKFSTGAIKEDNTQEGIMSEKEDPMMAIQALEREAEEAVKGLHESRQFISKISSLVQVAGELESQRQQTYSGSGIKKASEANQMGVPSMSGESPRSKNHEWQTTKSLFLKTGKSDILLKYIEDMQPNDLRFEVIDDIMKYVGLEEGLHKEPTSNTSQPHCETYTLNDTQFSLLQSNAVSSFPRRDINSQCSNVDGISFASQQSLKSSPVLHLDLTSLRSDSSNDYHNLPQHSDKKQSSPALTRETEVREKRESIRRWMREQRKKRLAQAQSTQNANVLSKNPSKRATSFMNGTLTSRQLRERSREREEKQAQLREKLQKKREEEVEKLLKDHEEELSTHRALIEERRCSSDSRIVAKTTQHNDSKPKRVSELLQGSSSLMNASPLPKKNAELAVKGSLPLHRGKLNINNISKHSRRVSSAHDKSFKSNSTLENDMKIQEEISHLEKCVRSSRKSRMAPRYSSWSTNRDEMPSFEGRFHSDQPDEDQKRMKSKKVKSSHILDNTRNDIMMKNNNVSSEKHLPRNESFSLPLDRISEVDSSSQSCGLNNVEQSPNGEDTSGEISWNVPDEIKMLLYK